MTNTEQTPTGIHVTFDGTAVDVINHIGALMASVADTFGVVTVLTDGSGMTREDAEGNILQAIYENAWNRLHRKREDREHTS